MTSYSQQSQALLSAIRSELETALPPTYPRRDRLLDCSSCEGFMAQPLCLPCGHSVCKCCLYKLRSSFTLSSILCPQCKHTCPHKPPGQSDDRKPTLILQKLCLPEVVPQVAGEQVRTQEGDFPLAVHWYNKAADTGEMDHRVLGNRSRSYLAMEQLEEALKDAELCCKLRPSWAKVKREVEDYSLTPRHLPPPVFSMPIQRGRPIK